MIVMDDSAGSQYRMVQRRYKTYSSPGHSNSPTPSYLLESPGATLSAHKNGDELYPTIVVLEMIVAWVVLAS